ncbi:hypothetical protein CEXT_271751 [Caerostris extrusa]|uniref:Uncharacterized protein n=1 Tax=Caerostris extrusa TaxID=172846 RepID=A0AAV4NC21_CAEEX|nr:hypothetical protein CEXT_271751 [Caerostris extrusa]
MPSVMPVYGVSTWKRVSLSFVRLSKCDICGEGLRTETRSSGISPNIVFGVQVWMTSCPLHTLKIISPALHVLRNVTLWIVKDDISGYAIP